MNADNPWRPFREVVANPWARARSWKDSTGGKVIGHLLPDVPEEIIHAAGALPVAIEGASVQVSHAQAHIPGYTCNHAMGSFDLKLRGELDVLDGMVVPYVCDTTRNLFHLWNHCFHDITNEFLRLPKRIYHQGAEKYLRAEFTRFLESMERVTGRKAGPGALAHSLTLYNQSRARLRQAYQCHRKNPAVWTADNVQTLLAAAFRSPRDQHLQWMEALPWDEVKEEQPRDRVRVYVKGKTWDPPGILRMMDQLGFLVVKDEVVTGFRSIEQDADLSLDPVDALVKRHIATVPYTGYHQEPRRIVTGFVDRVKESRAQGVIFLNPKFCEAAAFDTPDLQKGLEQESIPCLVLETATRGVSPQQFKLRLEAFHEMISSDLP